MKYCKVQHRIRNFSRSLVLLLRFSAVTQLAFLAQQAVASSKIFAIGSWFHPKTQVEYYDLSDDRWHQSTNLPTIRHGHTAASAHGQVYAIGGYDPWTGEVLGTTETFIDNEWATDESMNLLSARERHATCTLNGKIYAVGGYGIGITVIDYLNFVERFDPTILQWESVVHMPSAPRYDHAAACVHDSLYVIGGTSLYGHWGYGIQSSVLKFNTTSQWWSLVPSMPARRSQHCTAVADGMIFVIGGYDEYTFATKTVYRLDTSSETWTQIADLNMARRGCGAVSVQGKIYVVGGVGFFGENTEKTVEIYEPIADMWMLLSARTKHRFAYHGLAVSDNNNSDEDPIASGSVGVNYCFPFLLLTTARCLEESV